jgi:ABC-2 type transport system ATP-binding protein
MSSIVRVDNLRKSYESVKKDPGILGAAKGLFSREKVLTEAVKGVSFDLQPGEIVGFLGPNGAGKTTTIKMLAGILYPTSGTCEVMGYRPFDRNPEMLRKISLVMGNKMQLWWDLPARDSFQVMQALYEIPAGEFKKRLEFLADSLQIGEKLDIQVRKLSLGERMKCELIASLLHRPQVVFLDEPTIGLDVLSQKRIRDFLRTLNREDGSTILLTSHYMQDVEELCERVVLINGGLVTFDGSLDTLSKTFGDTKRIRVSFADEAHSGQMGRYGEVVEDSDGTAIIVVDRDQAPRVAGEILNTFHVTDIAIEEVPIEDVMRRMMTPS